MFTVQDGANGSSNGSVSRRGGSYRGSSAGGGAGTPVGGGPGKSRPKKMECWGADKPFANITENNLTAKSIAITVSRANACFFRSKMKQHEERKKVFAVFLLLSHRFFRLWQRRVDSTKRKQQYTVYLYLYVLPHCIIQNPALKK